MRILFISRKRASGVGGLSRFSLKLISGFPSSYYLSPDHISILFKLPFSKIDLIHLCDATLLPVGVLLKFLMRKPLALTAHGLDLTYPNPFYQAMLHLLLNKADGTILVSHPLITVLKNFSVSKAKIAIIPNGVSINHLKFTSSLPLPDCKGKIVLLSVGNLVKRKGHAWFIKNVFPKLSGDFVYLIVGDGPQRDVIKKAITKKVGGRVFLLGRLTDSQLGFILKRTAIYICPNQKVAGDFEGFGIACGEAAAMGLPVVATHVDGIPEVITSGKNGLLVNPKPKDFIQALNKLKSINKRRFMGKKAALFTKKHFSWEETCRKYSSFFNSIVGSKEDHSWLKHYTQKKLS